MRRNAVRLFLSCPAGPDERRASATVSRPLGWRSSKRAIQSIANGRSSTLNVADTPGADASDPTHDGALSGMTSNAGSFELFDRASITPVWRSTLPIGPVEVFSAVDATRPEKVLGVGTHSFDLGPWGGTQIEAMKASML